MFDKIFDLFKSEWPVLKTAPVSFLLSVLVGAIIGWVTHGTVTSTRIVTLEGSLDDYKVRLEGATPDEADKRIKGLERQLERAKYDGVIVEKDYVQCRMLQAPYPIMVPPPEKSFVEQMGAAIRAGEKKNNHLDANWLLDFSADAQLVSIKLIGCQDWIKAMAKVGDKP